MLLVACALVLSVATALAVACGDDDDDDDNGAATTAPTRPPVTATAARTPTVAASPGATGTPGAGSGVEVADRAVAAVNGRDAATLAQLIEPISAACTTAPGLGGPPPCNNAPGNPPDGTTVQAFPYNTCEREWQFDFSVFAQRFIEAAGDLYAVVEVELPPSTDPLAPSGAGHAAIFVSRDPAFRGQTAHALLLSEDAVIAAYSLCGGTPADFLADRPPLYGPNVVFEGPAYDGP